MKTVGLSPSDQQMYARQLVQSYIHEQQKKTETPLGIDFVYIVWFCKTLEHWKAMVITIHDGVYYEVTHDGDRNETYIGVYKKFDNVCVKDPIGGIYG